VNGFLARAGRTLFAISLAAFGIEQFIVSDFVPGRAPAWPAAMPGRLAFAYVTGALLIGAGAAIAANRQEARRIAVSTAAMIAAWALVRHLPIVAADHSLGGAWTNAGKALAMSGGALVVAGSLPPRRSEALLAIGRVCLAAFLVLAGIQHFLFAGFVQTLVPGWIPGRLFWTYFAGVALIAGGTGMLIPRTARLAATLAGLMVFLWVFMLHIPRAVQAPPELKRNEWTAVFEALAFSGVAFTLAGAGAPPRKGGPGVS
jgi:uncharacterized membrane protein